MASAKPKRPSPISLRLTEEEKEELNKLASGMPINAYIKSCLFRSSACKPKINGSTLVKDRKALAQAIGLLGQSELARNLSQIAYEAKSGSLLLDEQTMKDINLACEQITTIRLSLITALGLKDDFRA